MVLARGLRSAYAAVLAGDVRDPRDLASPRVSNPALMSSSPPYRALGRNWVKRFMATAPGEFEPTSRFYRLHAEGLSGTLRAGSTPDGSFSAPRPIHPDRDRPRVISVREAARLHGFPRTGFDSRLRSGTAFGRSATLYLHLWQERSRSQSAMRSTFPLWASRRRSRSAMRRCCAFPSGSGRRPKPRRAPAVPTPALRYSGR